MERRKLVRCAITAALVAVWLPSPAAHAQLSDLLKQASGGPSRGFGLSAPGGSGSLGGMLSGGGTSLAPGSAGNVAGLLQYCIKNNYLAANGASPVQAALMDRLGGNPSSVPGFTSGASGIVQAGNGKTLHLSGDDLKQGVTKQVCNRVLSQAKLMG